MPLGHLSCSGVRHLASLRFDLHPHLNLFIGPNASGKTSLLEAIHLLGSGKSFRSNSLDTVINHEQDDLWVFGRSIERGAQHALGFRHGRSGREIRIDGENVDRVAQLAHILPLQVIAPDTHFAFLKQARFRRGVLDWGLFHVEPQFFVLWSEYRRLLKQRNAALKQRRPRKEFAVWDEALVERGEALHKLRLDYLEKWNVALRLYVSDLLEIEDIVIQLKSGWRKEQSLAEVLEQDFARDFEVGFTGAGPHRADLRVRMLGQDARTEASQGQWKLLTLSLRLAQLGLFATHTGRDCILLLDDLAAELDSTRRMRVMAMLKELPLQIFATALGPAELDLSAWAEYAKFEINAGEITQT